MKKIFCIFCILTLLSNFSKCIEESIENNSISKLIGMVRMEIIDKVLLHLPKREEVNILKMIKEMIKAKEDYSFNDTESAYLVFKWISYNIRSNYDGDSDEPINVYNSGEGSTKGMSSLFNNMCMLLKVETGSISGYLKWANSHSYQITSDKEYFWNYVEINGQYYLIDVSKAADLNFVSINYYSEYIYLYFGTDPKIFIRLHFPKESKWQLLPEPYTFEKFESMAILFPFFYLFNYKTVSPDTSIITGNGKIILSSDKINPELRLEYICYDEYGDDTTIEYAKQSNKIEVEYNIDKNKCFAYCVRLGKENWSHTEPIVFYRTNYTSSDSNIENNN